MTKEEFKRKLQNPPPGTDAVKTRCALCGGSGFYAMIKDLLIDFNASFKGVMEKCHVCGAPYPPFDAKFFNNKEENKKYAKATDNGRKWAKLGW